MKKIIKDPQFYIYKYGASYAHTRSCWIFNATFHLCRFKFGADWWFNKWKLQELTVEIGFFQFSWTRFLP